MKHMGLEGKIAGKKWVFRGLKWVSGVKKNKGWQPNQKGKMVQNAGGFLKNGLNGKGVRPKISANCLLLGLNFRQNEARFRAIL